MKKALGECLIQFSNLFLRLLESLKKGVCKAAEVVKVCKLWKASFSFFWAGFSNLKVGAV